MWTIISNISSIVTCVAFMLYLIGHIWVIIKNRNNIYEKFSIIPLEYEINIEDQNNFLIVDDIGSEFSLESNYGINKIKIYRICYQQKRNGKLKYYKKNLLKTFNKLNKGKLYIRCDLGECVPITRFVITRSDCTKIAFDLYQSGKTGEIITDHYTYKLTLTGLLYHLCI